MFNLFILLIIINISNSLLLEGYIKSSDSWRILSRYCFDGDQIWGCGFEYIIII